MKIIYIKIKNYKSIRELEINDIENALILVGIYGRGFKLLLFKRNTMQIKQL